MWATRYCPWGTGGAGGKGRLCRRIASGIVGRAEHGRGGFALLRVVIFESVRNECELCLGRDSRPCSKPVLNRYDQIADQKHD